MQRWKLGLVVLAVAALLVTGAEVATTFKPPATAVVDIAAVFDQYDKRRDRQDELQVETKKLEGDLKELEQQYKDIEQELPLVEDLERREELTLSKVQIEMKVKRLKGTELQRLRETQLKYIQEIRDEITQEIEAYAKAMDLDLIVEKTVTAEGEGPAVGFRWPIVHFVKPEFEITKEIADRLNGRYRRNR
jgi:Skp family chaperone for outer membrane proteins